MERFSPRRRRLLIAAPALLLNPPGCTSGSSPPSDATVQSAVRRTDEFAAHALAELKVPGMAIAIVHGDSILHLKGYGIRKAGSVDQVDADTVFALASISKPIASTVLAALAGGGRFDWDDPMSRHDPAFRLNDAEATRLLTMRDLFCHRSGLVEHAGDLLEDLGYPREEILFRLRDLRPGGRFRAHYAYTNFGLSAAAFAAARSGGLSWEDLADRLLFAPAGMHTASYRHADYLARTNRAWLHVESEGSYVQAYDRDADAQSAVGGASASVRDMARWLQLHLNDGMLEGRRLVPAAAIRETRSAQIESLPADQSPSGRADYYGLGWVVSVDGKGRQQNAHSGAFRLGASTSVRMAADQKLGIVALTNAAPVGLPEAVTTAFMELALDGALSRDWLATFSGAIRAAMAAEFRGPTDYRVAPPQPLPAQPAATYAGRYYNPYYGELDVAEQAGQLILLLGPHRFAHPMRHWSGDQFVYTPSGENAVETSGVLFMPGKDGAPAQRVRIEYLDQKGEGDFARLPD